ncbi:MAG: sucrose phosphorylase, partial [Patescibacteria group bacterium]|nr:sucrose phosphorylase [Patescibacteria group bacterium]
QIDLDVENEGVRRMFEQAIKGLAKKGTKMLRLGAVGYVSKKRGTDNFMIPQTYKFIQWIAEVAHENGVMILSQVHHHHTTKIKLSKIEGVDRVYDFVLPMLMLRAIYSGNTKYLKNWIKIRPHNQITVLDTHDGIGIVDVVDLMPKGEIENTVNKLREYGGNATMRSTGIGKKDSNIYQQNITFYSAVGASDEKYLLSRAVQFFIPGIPQVYYVGLLAGENDEKSFRRSGVGKDLMRHNYTFEEVEESCKRDVVQRLYKLMKFRNSHEAFDGFFTLGNTNDKKLTLRWDKDEVFCELRVDFEALNAVIEYSDKKTGGVEFLEVC